VIDRLDRLVLRTRDREACVRDPDLNLIRISVD